MPLSIDFLPSWWHTGCVISRVAAVVYDGVDPFELGVVHEAWGQDRSDMGVPVMDLAICASRAGRVRTNGPFDIHVRDDLTPLDRADLIIVPALPRDSAVPGAVIEALRAAVERGTRIMSICTGAFVLGAAGILDGRRSTTHWMYTDELAARYPATQVVPEVLYVDDAPILTSAGTASGIDASLYLWRQEFGSAVANTVARRMVVPPQRDGGQAQFIRYPEPECEVETLSPVLTWVTENLAEEHAIPALAARAMMSPRTFARRFRAETGTTPHAWITAQRIRRAEQLLEDTTRSVEQIAEDVGFGNGTTLRHHLRRARGLSPQRYREQFQRAT